MFHANMGTIKDRNGKDIIEAEDIQEKSTPLWRPDYELVLSFLSCSCLIQMSGNSANMAMWAALIFPLQTYVI